MPVRFSWNASFYWNAVYKLLSEVTSCCQCSLLITGFKGTGSQAQYFLKALLVFNFLGCLVEINVKILLASMKTLTNLKTGPEAASKFLLIPPSLDSGKFRVNLCVLGGFRYDFSEPQGVLLGVVIVKISASESLQRVTARIFNF
jgi:hypothetical protein